jgi:hypothetical protein
LPSAINTEIDRSFGYGKRISVEKGVDKTIPGPQKYNLIRLFESETKSGKTFG